MFRLHAMGLGIASPLSDSHFRVVPQNFEGGIVASRKMPKMVASVEFAAATQHPALIVIKDY